MPPTTSSKNLGQVSAVWTGSTPPTNRFMLWIDNGSLPYKRKFWDNVTEQWLEAVFLPSPANVLKKLVIRSGGDTTLTTDDDVYIITAPTATLQLPTPSAAIAGASLRLCNYSGGVVTYSLPVTVDSSTTITTQTGVANSRIAVAELGGVYVWVKISD